MIRIIAYFSCLALLFVWSLPGSIALRHLLMFVGLLTLIRVTHWPSLATTLRHNLWPFIWLLALTLWLIAQALFISPESSWSLSELRGQWGKGVLAGALGLLFAEQVRKEKNLDTTWISTALIAVLIIQAALAVGQSLFHWVKHGELLREQVPLTGGKLEMSYILNILLAALSVDLLFRSCQRPQFLRLPMFVVIIATLLALFAMYLAGARNGILGVLFLSISGVVLYLFETRRVHGLRHAVGGSVLLLLVVTSFAFASYRSDPRWQSFIDTIPIAWDIDSNRTWLDSSPGTYPTLPDGKFVDPSAYIRIAFIHAGLREIASYPLGVGYGRNAFSHAIKQKEDAQLGHAHSGWIDLGIGGGIPALILWAAFLGSLILISGIRYFRYTDPHALWLLFISSGYAGRMVVDSVNRDHMLQIFFFLSFYLIAISIPPDKKMNCVQ